MLWRRHTFNRYYFPAACLGGNGQYVRGVGTPRTVGITGECKFQ